MAVAGPLTPDDVLERARELAPTLRLATRVPKRRVLTEKGGVPAT